MFSANSSQVSGDKLFVEDVFSTYLYTGNASTQTITNGIDLAGKGGLVWTKNRITPEWNCLADTTRGLGNNLFTNDTAANQFQATGITSASSTGYTIGSWIGINATQANASWTFREAPKFFDVVTWTGNSTYNRQIPHSLGVTPGFIIVKATSTTTNWVVYHRSSDGMYLNTTDAASSTIYPIFFGDGTNAVAPTATNFTVGGAGAVNASGQTYVAYVFAHDTTADGVIQCGSFTTDGTGAVTVNLGWEPQWLLYKRTDATQDWVMLDNMRGFSQTNMGLLNPNTSAAETQVSGNYIFPTATGFQMTAGAVSSSAPYIYIAIRRGPMRTPTLGTSVFAPVLQAPNSTAQTKSFGFVTDVVLADPRDSAGPNNSFWSRLRGPNTLLSTAQTNPETSTTDALIGFDSQDGVRLGVDSSSWIQRTFNWIYYAFRRAPGFFDEVCYAGNYSVQNVKHNLGVAPELIIIKARDTARGWAVYAAPLGATQFMFLNSTDQAVSSSGFWNDTAPTSTQFTVGNNLNTNYYNNVAYLFASAPGVSKVGTYTGNGSSQTIDCGFAAGARFVMIKRTDSTGDWYVWDTARGIVAGNDPHLSLNTTAAEVTTDDTIDPDSSGFVVNQVAATNVNVNAATYIYLAIA